MADGFDNDFTIPGLNWTVIDGAKHHEGLLSSICRFNNTGSKSIALFTDHDLVNSFVKTLKAEYRFPFPIMGMVDLRAVVVACRENGITEITIDPVPGKQVRCLSVQAFIDFLDTTESS